MSYQPSVLEQLQLDIGAIVQSCPPLAAVPVNIVRPRANNTAVMIQDKINKALEGTQGPGATIVIDMPQGDVPQEEIQGPQLFVLCAIRVIENPIQNMGTTGTQISAEDISLLVLNLLHSRFFQNAGSTLIADKNAMEPRLDYLQKNFVAYDVRLRMKMGLSGPLKTPMPGLAGNSASGVTITAPNGAVVYYTLDGSYPWSGNTAAVLLSSPDPIAVTVGAQVRSVATNPNLQASDNACLNITS